MDSKGEESKMSYPNIFFMIDNFEEVTKRPGPAVDQLWRLQVQTLTGVCERCRRFSAT